ncbi:MAG: zinc/iron-chelating domain-containing protein [Flavobacteriales bacterium]|nr:zinc/iron-chelating domain-containing protein [Flavobacteriales bacterium]|tara:strand:- start:235 stop:714 length:480 start_codon:yes stop_codon:yes gene_type:complete
MDLEKHRSLVQQKAKENKKFIQKLKYVKSKVLDEKIHQLHEEVFACTNCLECANCCTTTGPLFTDKDIGRISKHLKIKPSEFTEKYLKVDEEKDFVLQQVPCTFLEDDNRCSIYKVRPKACLEYPHTNRRKQYQILKLTQKNIAICPAVYRIVEKLKYI